MSVIARSRRLVENGQFYLTEHAKIEADDEGFNIYDIENSVMTGRTKRSWPKKGTFEIVGKSWDGRKLGLIVRETKGSKLRVITVYEDRPG